MTEIPGLGGGWGHRTGRRVHGRGPECHLHPAPRLAKSTLTLIPLLGTHEVIFAFVMDEHARGMLRFIKLFTELSFTSFQVTSSLGPPSSSPRVGMERGPACVMQTGSLRPGGKVALTQVMWLEQSQSPQVC